MSVVALNKAIRKLRCSRSVSNLFSRKFRPLLLRNTRTAANDHHRKSDSVAVLVLTQYTSMYLLPGYIVAGPPVQDRWSMMNILTVLMGTIEKLGDFI